MAVNGGVEVLVRRVTAGYGGWRLGRTVLHEVDLTAPPGRVTAVVGPNGVGKTTLFRLVLGYHRPSAGEVRVGGETPSAWRHRHGIGFLPEWTPRPPGWTTEALLAEGCDLLGLAGAARRRALDAALERCGLDAAARARPLTELSRGSARRAVLAYALLDDPGLVLLDEPLTGLDAEARKALRRLVSERAAAGATVMLTGHELDEVARMADRAVVLRDGRVAEVLERRTAGAELERAVLGPGAADHGVPGFPWRLP